MDGSEALQGGGEMNLEKKAEIAEKNWKNFIKKVRELEMRVTKLEEWKKSKEESELVLERYQEVFQPKTLKKKDIQKLKNLMEKKKRELVKP
jgi:hypothetical protein